MAKIKLGSRPKTVLQTLTVQLPEGGEGTIRMSYVYRTRTEFGEFVDGLVRAAGVAAPKSQADEDVVFSLRESLEMTRDKNAEYILQVATGWDLDEEFNLANVQQMCDELPGLALLIIEHYRRACTEGRLGN